VSIREVCGFYIELIFSYFIERQYLKTLTIDLGGTRAKMGIVEKGKMVAHSIWQSNSGGSFKDTIQNLENQIAALLDENSLRKKDIFGIGLSFPGLVNVKQHTVISTNKKFDLARNFNFIRWAKGYANWPIILENDARAALYGEWQYGAGKGCDHIVMMTLGTGIGGVCLIEGKALYGKHFQAGVLGGHFTIHFKGEQCSCGNIGCVESIGSTWKIKETIKAHPEFKNSLLYKENKYDFETVFKCYRKKDKTAKEVLNTALKSWAAGVVNMIHAYDPEMVILHGGIMKSADIILPFIQNYVNKYAWTPWGVVQVCKSHYEDFAALYGMDYLLKVSIEKH
jgi:glucokinase